MSELAVLVQQYFDAHANRNVKRKPMDRFQRTGDKKFEKKEIKGEKIKGIMTRKKKQMIREMMLGMI